MWHLAQIGLHLLESALEYLNLCSSNTIECTAETWKRGVGQVGDIQNEIREIGTFLLLMQFYSYTVLRSE